MPPQTEKAASFAALHRPGDPLILYNIWDPGSARSVAAAGAKAIATGSWSVAAAFGFDDGEALPLDLALDNLARIVAAVDLPVTIDLEGGYAAAPEAGAETASRAIRAGAVGFNFEDRGVGGDGLHPAAFQARRIAAIRGAAEAEGLSFFINARTDNFLGTPADAHAGLIADTLERARAYAEAGANGLFVPGLVDADLIARICAESPLPVNVMAMPGAPDVARLAALGVARISHGPGPYRLAMEALRRAAETAHGAL
jgi:2-methylisocitrate lyase-like PEP mutase family enzyme